MNISNISINENNRYVELYTLCDLLMQASFVNRIKYIARFFVDRTPYGSADDDLLEELNCMTYVETVLGAALASIGDFNYFTKDVVNKIDLFRYKGAKSFANRNHFMSADWLEHNAKFLKDITFELSRSLDVRKAVISRKDWLQNFPNEHLLHGAAQQEVTVPYYAFAKILAKQNSIELWPKVAIFSVVRSKNWSVQEQINTELPISHIGFIFKEHNSLRVLHSTKINNYGVCELDLFEYIKSYAGSSAMGLNIQQVLES